MWFIVFVVVGFSVFTTYCITLSGPKRCQGVMCCYSSLASSDCPLLVFLHRFDRANVLAVFSSCLLALLLALTVLKHSTERFFNPPKVNTYVHHIHTYVHYNILFKAPICGVYVCQVSANSDLLSPSLLATHEVME